VRQTLAGGSRGRHRFASIRLKTANGWGARREFLRRRGFIACVMCLTAPLQGANFPSCSLPRVGPGAILVLSLRDGHLAVRRMLAWASSFPTHRAKDRSTDQAPPASSFPRSQRRDRGQPAFLVSLTQIAEGFPRTDVLRRRGRRTAGCVREDRQGQIRPGTGAVQGRWREARGEPGAL
jgi:hypothetical protein